MGHMSADAVLDPSFRQHPKVRALLAAGGPDAAWAWVALIGWVTEAESGGALGTDVAAIAQSAGWSGSPDRLIDLLTAAGLVDLEFDGWHLHDYEQWNPGGPTKCSITGDSESARSDAYYKQLSAARLRGRHTPSEWQALIAQQGGRCARCSSLASLLKHRKVPLRAGGDDSIANLEGLCVSCARGGGAAVGLPPELRSFWERFWERYPRKRNPGRAVEACQRLDPDPVLQQAILDDLEWRLQFDDGFTAQWAPYPATYLNDSRWEDGRDRAGPDPDHKQNGHSAAGLRARDHGAAPRAVESARRAADSGEPGIYSL